MFTHEVLDEETPNATFYIDKENWFRSFFSRFTVETVHNCVTASRKSDRSFIGAFLPDLFSVIFHFFRYLSDFSSNGQLEWSSFANLSIAMHVSSVQPILSCESRNVESCRKRS